MGENSAFQRAFACEGTVSIPLSSAFNALNPLRTRALCARFNRWGNSMRSGRNEDKDARKTSRVGRNTIGEIPYREHSHNTSIEPSFRSRVASPQSLTFCEVRNVWGHISRRIQQLPLNSRAESLTSFSDLVPSRTTKRGRPIFYPTIQ